MKAEKWWWYEQLGRTEEAEGGLTGEVGDLGE